MTPPPPIRQVPEQLAELFDAAAKLGRSAMEADFIAAAKLLSAGWTAEEIERALLQDGSLEALMSGTVGQELFADFRDELRDSYEGPREPDGRRLSRHRAPLVNAYVSASDAAVVTSPIRDDWWTTERWTQNAIDWVDRTSAQKITQVTEATKGGVRALIKEAFGDGNDRAWIAKTMVALDADGSLRLGLDAPRSRTLMIFTNDLDPSIPAGRRRRLIDRRYRQLLRSRAETISQTEVVDLGNVAQMDTFQSAALEGELDARLYVVEWVTRAIGCPRCIAFDSQTREISSGRFVSDGSGPKGVETASMPEIHPRGWCFTRIVRRSEAKNPPTL